MAKRGENIHKRKDGRLEGRYIKGRTSESKPVWGYVYGHSYTEVKSVLTRKKSHFRPLSAFRRIHAFFRTGRTVADLICTKRKRIYVGTLSIYFAQISASDSGRFANQLLE